MFQQYLLVSSLCNFSAKIDTGIAYAIVYTWCLILSLYYSGNCNPSRSHADSLNEFLPLVSIRNGYYRT